jgi:hypothetical protein
VGQVAGHILLKLAANPRLPSGYRRSMGNNHERRGYPSPAKTAYT